MKAEIEVECEPWEIPQCIAVKGMSKTVLINNAPYDLIKAMLEKFTDDVWAKFNEPETHEE